MEAHPQALTIRPVADRNSGNSATERKGSRAGVRFSGGRGVACARERTGQEDSRGFVHVGLESASSVVA